MITCPRPPELPQVLTATDTRFAHPARGKSESDLTVSIRLLNEDQWRSAAFCLIDSMVPQQLLLPVSAQRAALTRLLGSAPRLEVSPALRMSTA